MRRERISRRRRRSEARSEKLGSQNSPSPYARGAARRRHARTRGAQDRLRRFAARPVRGERRQKREGAAPVNRRRAEKEDRTGAERFDEGEGRLRKANEHDERVCQIGEADRPGQEGVRAGPEIGEGKGRPGAKGADRDAGHLLQDEPDHRVDRRPRGNELHLREERGGDPLRAQLPGHHQRARSPLQRSEGEQGQGRDQTQPDDRFEAQSAEEEVARRWLRAPQRSGGFPSWLPAWAGRWRETPRWRSAASTGWPRRARRRSPSTRTAGTDPSWRRPGRRPCWPMPALTSARVPACESPTRILPSRKYRRSSTRAPPLPRAWARAPRCIL